MKSIRQATGRSVLLVFVLGSLIVTVAALLYVGRGGAIGAENMGTVGQLLADSYLPLIGIMAAFYFSERGVRPEGITPIASLLLSLVIIGLWLTIPFILLVLPAFSVEDLIAFMRGAGPYGETLAAGALTFYFSGR